MSRIRIKIRIERWAKGMFIISTKRMTNFSWILSQRNKKLRSDLRNKSINFHRIRRIQNSRWRISMWMNRLQINNRRNWLDLIRLINSPTWTLMPFMDKPANRRKKKFKINLISTSKTVIWNLVIMKVGKRKWTLCRTCI